MEEMKHVNPFSWRAAGMGDAWSALPDAPQVVEQDRRDVFAPARATAARLLYRLAVIVEPAHSSAA